MCCMANGLITEHGAPMSLSTHSMDEIWNSAYMRNVRRGMLKGERLSACKACYESEAVSGHSYRTLAGLTPIPGKISTKADVRKLLGAGYRAQTRPAFLKLELGNLCNLKCRMCFGVNSSEIERDPVHGAWTKGTGGIEPQHAVWRGDAARIGPEPHIGVRRSGLFAEEYLDGALRCWTDGYAIFNVPLLTGTPTESLEISFHSNGIRNQHFQVIVNGRPMAKGVLNNPNNPLAIGLNDFRNDTELVIEILSNKIIEAAGQPERGLPLSGLVLRRQLTASVDTNHPQRLSSQLAADGPWYADDHKIFDELLSRPQEIQRLNITGGETFISKRFFEILEFLAASGSKHIHFELPTNCTHVDDKILERLKSFPHVQLILSLDGAGETYEYIRYPARWKVVEANVRKLVQSGIPCVAAPVVQIYNVLRLPELYDYCDSLGIRVVENILFEPNRLAISALPPKTRKFAADRLLNYCEVDCQIKDKTSRLSVAHYLCNLTSPADPNKIREFMLFTNDLDATRGQNFRITHPDLVQLLAEDGFEWADDTLLANNNETRTPARDREYAWL